ncbi:hypothetical protein D3874_01425 [Oleomonas cavernae]|uniref:Uncharacterized protein n=1 Tax=Oleomonas cavernae TaxID=2320859 RepID=A0A418WTD7_9PROT|nr:hypothetical protein [Oleomonas cavernae]RJF94524.1 hypothetical protein D3874_01425 [Oleomonas cavernae]
MGVLIDTDAGATDWEHTYNWPPEIGEAPAYHAYSSTELVSSVSQTINGIHVLTYEPQDDGTLGAVMDLTGKAIGDVTALLNPVVEDLLDPLLSPTLALLLDDTLGMDLGKVEVGTNLTCGSGDARLVN